jgi:hypothetical protein
VLLTFGLLSPDKGIEHVIDALPAILASHPATVYIVLGVTHPHVRQSQGETYRLGLEERARRLGVDTNIIFHDRFVSQRELTEFLCAADIYITPYLKAEQSTSGTLAYAVGCGRPVISTPYWHARELLDDGRGILVPWADPQAIAHEVNLLLGDDAKRLAMGQRAAAHGRDMVWPMTARRYLQSFERARVEHTKRLRIVFQAKTLAKRPGELPEVNLDHLRLMTDDTGLLQHAVFSVPRYEDGYCLDDNARALLLMTLVGEAGTADPKEVRGLVSRYLAFVSHAFDRGSGRFQNFLSYERRWSDSSNCAESHGRALWALGSGVGRSGHPGLQSLGGNLFHSALPAVQEFSSPRAWAFALLGIDEYLRAFDGDSNVQAMRKILADRLVGLFERTSTNEWPWFEDRATYCNARLSQALIVSGGRMAQKEMTAIGLKSLEWLAAVQRSDDGAFAPIGSNGFYKRGEPRAVFDQQPVEAGGMVSACLDAFRVTGNDKWAEHARRAFSWLLGKNHLQQPLYDATTGGCHDGLHADRVNANQGAESTLSFLLALCELRAADGIRVAKKANGELRHGR